MCEKRDACTVFKALKAMLEQTYSGVEDKHVHYACQVHHAGLSNGQVVQKVGWVFARGVKC